ncbi:TPA: restriction endonuclease, partial [Legionella pneumophila]|nr:restriction endonuclease [Legionella pneumophila]
MKIYSFDTLANADLIIDAVYEGGSSGNASDDPISKIIKGI